MSVIFERQDCRTRIFRHLLTGQIRQMDFDTHTASHSLHTIGVNCLDVVGAGDKDGRHNVPHPLKQISIFLL